MSSTPAADDRLELRAGARPLPDYELVARLGKGGFGEVWKAIGPGRVPVALKFIPLDQNASAVEQKALDLMLEVRHAHLLDLHGYWQRHGHLILAMSLADGTLLDRLGQVTSRGQPGLPIDELLTYLEEAAKGLDFLAGKRMQHRDVKPGNLLLVGGSVKVADYGLARVLEKSVTDTKEGGYTLSYAAPELINKQVSLRVDQYALAVSYCQLRAGRLPFGGSPQQVMVGHLMHAPDLTMLPEAERPAVARALAKKPEDRWPSCLAFVQALKQQTVSAGPPPSATPGPQAALNTVSSAEPRVTTWPVPVSDRPPEAPATWQQQPTLTRAPRGRRWWWLGLTAAALMAAVGVGLRALLSEPEPSTASTAPERSDRPPGPPKPEPPPPTPTLRLTALQPATVTLKPGQMQTVTVQVVRENCPDAITVQVDGLPDGVTTSPADIAAGSSQGRLTLRAAATASRVSALAVVHARAGPTSAERQLLVTVSPGPKLELLALDPVALDAGGQATLTVRVRRTHCPGVIGLRASYVPARVRIGAGVIADDQDSGRLELSASADAGSVNRDVTVEAYGNGASASGTFRLTVKPPPGKQAPELLVAPFSPTKARQAQQAWADYLGAPVEETVDLGGVELKLVLIPPGTYRRGSPDDDKDAQADEKPQREITISKAFYLGKTEVTRGQFRRFVTAKQFKTEAESDGEGGWGFNETTGKLEGRDPKYNWQNAGFKQDDEHPVVNVTWNDAVAFMDWLRERGGGVYGLPREAEWEYAARAGTTTRWVSGDDPESLATVGNVADATLKKQASNITTISAEDGYAFTAPVGKFRANAFGLYDMTGNVWEWCHDWYDTDYYKDGNIKDPKGPLNGDARMLRGGSWFYRPVFCRVAYRNWVAPTNRSSVVGFRALLRLD